jgi:hypothetical protein
MKAEENNTKVQTEVIYFENRRYPRFDIHLPMEYYQVESSVTYTGNISEDGLLIYFPKGTNVRRYLRLKLFFSLGSKLNAIKALAEVVWKHNDLRKSLEYDQYGAKFIDISRKDRTKLRKFLRSLSSSLDDMVDQWSEFTCDSFAKGIG